MKIKYNYLGVQIDGKRKLAKEEFGTYNEEGEPMPYWVSENEFVDGDGFDKSYRGTNGYWDEIILPVGTRLSRYGNERGRLTTDSGTDYSMLALPYDKETVEYHEYVVTDDDLKVKCQVKRGLVYKMFDSDGGGIQYLHEQAIGKEIKEGKIKEVFAWLLEKKNALK